MFKKNVQQQNSSSETPKSWDIPMGLWEPQESTGSYDERNLPTIYEKLFGKIPYFNYLTLGIDEVTMGHNNYEIFASANMHVEVIDGILSNLPGIEVYRETVEYQINNNKVKEKVKDTLINNPATKKINDTSLKDLNYIHNKGKIYINKERAYMIYMHNTVDMWKFFDNQHGNFTHCNNINILSSGDVSDVIAEIYSKAKLDLEIQKDPIENVFYVYTIQPGANGLQLAASKVSLEDGIEISQYSHSIQKQYRQLVKHLRKDKKGLSLLSGEPGTGKTTLIRKLMIDVRNAGKKFIFLNAQNAEILGNPSIFALLTNNPDNIIILEDCESAVGRRVNTGEGDQFSNRSAVTANLLNLTDGILADIVRTQVIMTMNTDENTIDPAFLRKGRLCNKLKFEKHTEDEANNFLHQKGSSRRVVGSHPLCDLWAILREEGKVEIASVPEELEEEDN